MSLDVAPGITAQADYWPGEAGKPPVLVVHGFLQTRTFPTVRRLAESLADEGYSVLAPTLSLGIDARQQSLACEAIHTHDMQQDVDELRAWATWLTERTGRPPIIAGHSSGATQVAALLDTYPDLPLSRTVLVSPCYFGAELGASGARLMQARATRDLAAQAENLQHYSLSYCRQYTSPPAPLLSYLHWDSTRVQRALGKARAPRDVIYGDRDERIDQAWIEAMRDTGVAVRVIAGADHFFDRTHEFDLLDEVMSAISRADDE